MKRTSRMQTAGFLLLLCLLMTVPAYGAGWVLYDDFNSGVIDPTKWYGGETGKTGAEVLRMIVTDNRAKKLRLLERGYGYTDSDVGSALQNVKLNFPDSLTPKIRGIKALVKPITFEAVGCSTNSSATWIDAYLARAYFNSNPQGPSSYANDVYSWIGVSRHSGTTDAEDTARVVARIAQCKDDQCNQTTTLFWHDFGNIKEGQQVNLLMEWDNTNHRFIFQRDSQKPVYFTYNLPDTSPPVWMLGRLGSEALVPNCTSSPRPTGSMNALFDNLYIKTFSP